MCKGHRGKRQLPCSVAIPRLMQHAAAIGTNRLTAQTSTWRPTLDCPLLARPSGCTQLLPGRPSTQVVFYSGTHITNNISKERFWMYDMGIEEHDKPGFDMSWQSIHGHVRLAL